MTQEKRIKPVKNKKKSLFQEKIISLCINNEKDLYNRFTFFSDENIEANASHMQISDEVINFLERQMDHVPPFIPVTIELRLKERNEEKLKRIEESIKAELTKKTFEIDIAIAKMRRNGVLLVIAGVIPLTFRQIFSALTSRYALTELFLVMAWVFMWKAVEILFFNRPELAKRKMKFRRILKAEFSLSP